MQQFWGSLEPCFKCFKLFSIQDLLKHTPTSHPDHPLLQDALRISQNFLSSINEESTPRRQLMTVKKGEVRRFKADALASPAAFFVFKLLQLFAFRSNSIQGNGNNCFHFEDLWAVGLGCQNSRSGHILSLSASTTGVKLRIYPPHNFIRPTKVNHEYQPLAKLR